jgi:P27 family predicted phage terminase small subunit
MNADLIALSTVRSSGEGLAYRHSAAQRSAICIIPSVYLVDEIAREEWERVSAALLEHGSLSLEKRSLLAGYCNAVAKAVRAEQTLAVEGRYYETKTKRGSLMRRRHPAAQDAEEGWTAARQLAKQLGITGGAAGARQREHPRRRVFK